MSQEVFFQNKPSLRARENRYCPRCQRSTEHLKEAGQTEFKCQPCEDRKNKEAALQKGSGI